MAQLDLKKVVIRFQDGYQLLGTVGGTAPAVGASTMTTVFGANVAVVTGDFFTIGANTNQFKVTAHVETSGSTTSITFTPPIPTGFTVTTGDAVTVGPHFIQVKVGEGTLSYTEKKARQYIKDRGLLSEVRDGEQDPVEVRMDFIWDFIRGQTGDPPTIEDVLKNRGNASTWITTSADPCEPFCVDIVALYTPACAIELLEQLTLPEFRYEDLAHDFKNGTVALTGKCNVTEAISARLVRAA